MSPSRRPWTSISDWITRLVRGEPAVDTREQVELGYVTAPSGKLVFVDVAFTGLPDQPDQPQQVVVDDLPRNTELRVVGTRPGASDDGLHLDSWDHVDIVCIDAAESAGSELLGHVVVDAANVLIADSLACSKWQQDDSHDGLADVVFWGLRAPELADMLGAPTLPGVAPHFGWLDLPIEEARERAAEVEEREAELQLHVPVDLRPHSDRWKAYASLEASPIDVGQFDLHGARACLIQLMSDGLYPVHRRLDAAGRTVAVRIDIEAAFDE